jgi:hypothetical protein
MTNQELLNVLINYYNEFGKSPSAVGFPKSTTYKNRFGSWNNALIQANLPTYKSPHSFITKPCEVCKKECKRSQLHFNKFKHIFCSNSCSAKFTNKTRPKRTTLPDCIICKKRLTSHKYEVCMLCRREEANKQSLASVIHSYGKDKYNNIRARARELYKQERTNGTCAKCNYKGSLDVCHIKPISSFHLETKVSEINHKDNILILCKNCHWEFDHPNVK